MNCASQFKEQELKLLSLLFYQRSYYLVSSKMASTLTIKVQVQDIAYLSLGDVL